MIQLTPHMRILVATTPLDMRKGIDGIAAHCRLVLEEHPMSGAVFVFISRSRKMLKLLTYDGQGFWLATKRLSRGRFPPWTKAASATHEHVRLLEAYQAHLLLQGADPDQVRALSPWKKIARADAFFSGVV